MRRRKEEQEQDDITLGEMAEMTEPKKDEASIRISVILLMRWHCVVLVFQSPRCGHLCGGTSLRASSHKAC